jgi:hypothetical protein
MQKKLIILTIVCLLFTFSSYSNQYGTPTIRHYLAVSTPELTQTFSIAQDQSGRMYFGNSYGITRFDGNFWSVIKIANNSVVFSLAIADSMIYVGGIDEFGRLSTLDNGTQVYSSYLHKLPVSERNFGVVRNIFTTNKAVIFVADLKMFILENDSIRVINTISIFQKSFIINNNIYTYQKDIGLFVLKNDRNELIIPQKMLGDDPLIYACQINQNVYGVSEKGYVFLLDLTNPDHLQTVIITAASEFVNITSVTNTHDKILLGTNEGKLLIINPEIKKIELVRVASDQIFSRILCIYADIFKNIWIGHDSGVSYIEYNSSFSYIDSKYVKGTGYAAEQNNNFLYLGTSQGLYVIDSQYISSGIPQMVNNSNGQVWFLKYIDECLFMGHDKGLYKIDGNLANPINNLKGSWDIKNIEGTNLYIEGTYSGLQLFQFKNNSLQLVSKLNGFYESSRVFEIEADKKVIWISHGYKGVFKINLSNTFDSITSIDFYDEKAGFPASLGINVFKIKNEIVFTSEHGGIYRYSEVADSFFLDLTYSNYIGKYPLLSKLIEDKNGNIWICELNEIGVLIPNSNNTFQYFNTPFFTLNNSLVRGFELIKTINNNEILFGYGNGFIQYNPNIKKDYDQSFYALINKVELISYTDSIVYYGISFKTNHYNKTIPYTKNSLRFRFSSAYFEEPDKIQFSCWLEGFDKDWSKWMFGNQREYTNLPAGKYTFKVKAKNIYNKQSEIAEFSFEILKPWYATICAIIFYGVAFSCITYLFLLYYTAFKQKESRKELLKKEREIIQLKNQKLSNELQHLNNELGSLTLHITHKNEVLTKIKIQLDTLQNTLSGESIKFTSKILELIENELTNEEDWKYFELHFDKVYNNFFKQLKSVYPDLNSSELKLCSYLRMDLSSKEIASLMNSTPGGVDANRYRLRKKLNLTQDDNLKDFIMRLGLSDE